MSRRHLALSVLLAAVVIAAAPGRTVAEAPAAPAGNAVAGEAVFKRCAACHRVGPGAANGLGPALNGVVGRAPGAVAGFKYSPAMAGAKAVWSRDALSRFLASPRTAMPGTRMVFAGLPNAKDRDDVIAYLALYSPSGAKKK
ncbi:c-type cytochrome [Sphingomonas sp. CJ20]